MVTYLWQIILLIVTNKYRQENFTGFELLDENVKNQQTTNNLNRNK